MRALKGIWESETRKQNGHYQSGTGTPPVPDFDTIEIPVGKQYSLTGFFDPNDGHLIYFAPGYSPKTTPTIKQTIELQSGNFIYDYGNVEYIPDTGIFTEIDNTHGTYDKKWFTTLDTINTPLVHKINLGNANESGTGTTQVLISGVSKEWVIPTVRLIKGSTGTTQAEMKAYLDTLGIHRKVKVPHGIVRSDTWAVGSLVTAYGGAINNINPNTAFINNFKMSYDDWNEGTDPYSKAYLGTQFYYGVRVSDQWINLDDDAPHYFSSGLYYNYNSTSGRFDDRCVAVTVKLEIKQYPMTS